MKSRDSKVSSGFLSLMVMLVAAFSLSAQTTEFTYQGKLTDTGDGTPSATYDFELRLWDVESGGGMPLATLQRLGVAVTGGIFTFNLDFGPASFDGSNRWLEIAVKRPPESSICHSDAASVPRKCALFG